MNKSQQSGRVMEISGGFAKATTTHDIGGTWTRFYTSVEAASDPAAGTIEVCHEDARVRVNVCFSDLNATEALRWANLLTTAAIFANGLPPAIREAAL